MGDVPAQVLSGARAAAIRAVMRPGPGFHAAAVDAAAESAYATARTIERAQVVAHLTALAARPPRVLNDAARGGWLLAVATVREHLARGEHLG